ncbi:tripartite tricarboxylate transporter substrate-binding protein [Salipiger sp. H15]|uniref:Tripartite tricarboxylate transporter substrate-binding protein n=1 Tax=Alloyangia sp. H15 TaxID=3029062 RepID=A0AAU8ANZ1_9RHOB
MTISLETLGRATRATALALVTCTLAVGAASAQSYPDPGETLDWTIAFGPGGGNDIMARTMVDIIQKYDLYPGNIRLENRAGGSGAVGWGHLYAQAGSGYGISTTSGSLITTPLQADTPWKPEDFTPIALMATDDLAIMVRGDSPWQTIEDYIEAGKTTPPTIAGTGTVNVDFIVPKLFSDKAGFGIEYVSFNSMADMQTALLSGAVDSIVANPGEIVGLVDSGDMRALVYSGAKTPPELGDVPTMAEKGYDIGVSMPRGVILAPDAPAEAQAFWIDTMKKIAATPEWAEYISTNLLTENIIYGEDFKQFLERTQAGFAEVLRAQGVIQ